MTVSAGGPIVGVVGTGRMGSAMATALARAGRTPVLWNRDPAKAGALAASLGATVAGSAAGLAATSDVVLTMLADDEAVRAVYGGSDGLVAAARPGTVLVDCSTVTPGVLAEFVRDAGARGVGLLDAPVSGSTSTAESGQLTLMVGGEADDLERARPALEPLAKAIFHLGPLGTGSAMKLAVNTLIFGLNQALAEGLVLAEVAGVDRATAYDVLAASAAGAPFVGYKRAAFLDPAGTPVAFSVDLAAKDLRLITGFAAARGLDVPQALVNLGVVADASARGRGGADFAAVAEVLREAVANAPAEVAPRSSAKCRPSRPRNPSHAGGNHGRSDPHQERDRPHPGQRPGRAAPCRRAGRWRHDRRRRPRPHRGRRAGHRRRRRHRHPGLHRHPPAHVGDVDPDLRARLRADHVLRLDPRQVRARTTGPTTSTRRTCGAPSSASTRASRRSWTGRTS